jgi:integrase
MSSKQPSRRTKVKNHRGVYYRQNAKGQRTYEFCFTDSDGKLRWQTVPGGLHDAVAARAEQTGRKHRGERVAPSKTTFREFADAWLEGQVKLRPRTLEAYRYSLERHVYPAFGKLRVEAITADRVAALIAKMQRDGYAAWTIKGVLTPLSRIFNNAARRGMIAANPLTQLERSERPSVSRREVPELSEAEIQRLLDAFEPRWRPLFSAFIYLGLRSSEARGLTWANVDLTAGIVRVRRQVERSKDKALVLPKTEAARRDVYLKGEPAKVARVLREHKAASRFSQEQHLVFASAAGTALEESTIRRVLNRALDNAKLPHLTIHDLRHVNASLRLVRWGEDVVYVSGQLGHADPSITYSVYAHLIDRAKHVAEARAAMEAQEGELGKSVESSDGQEQQNGAPLRAV